MSNSDIHTIVSAIYTRDSRKIFAALVRLLGQMELAEEALHEAFTLALQKWEEQGIPANPVSWLISTGRFRAIDRIRRDARFVADDEAIALAETMPDDVQESVLEDDTLRLIFTCCHPAVASDVRIALTLREVCGFKTEEIAQAFLTRTTTIAQRIVRGKQKIRTSAIPFTIPSDNELPHRLDAVLLVIYLIFNEGYNASSGESALRLDLVSEAIRLGEQLASVLEDAEVHGLLALMLLHHARSPARTAEDGSIILLEHQQRADWDQQVIRLGRQHLEKAISLGYYGTYTLQATIAFEHCRAHRFADTNWAVIVLRYEQLLSIESSPIVRLNYAVAVAMAQNAQAGLTILDAESLPDELGKYHLYHCARADMLEKLGRFSEAMMALYEAKRLTHQRPEQQIIEVKIANVQSIMKK